jgi:gliding motility-associated-like protein
VTQPACPEAVDSVSIHVGELIVPSVITPNNDGLNDFFNIPGTEGQGPIDIVIFNRWGNQVYSTDDYQNDWQGKDDRNRELPADTYFYIVTLQTGRILKGYVVIKR